MIRLGVTGLKKNGFLCFLDFFSFFFFFFVPGFIQEWKTWGGSKISSFISGINLGNEEVE